jgi:hypothetical protein
VVEVEPKLDPQIMADLEVVEKPLQLEILI